jgi:hypothetical protein
MTELDFLKKPEYIHIVLNHLPIFGTILGAKTVRGMSDDAGADLCSGIAVYIAQPGGQVRHPEFRPIENLTPFPKLITTTDKCLTQFSHRYWH